MKKFLSLFMLSVLSLPAAAASHDEQVEMHLEAAALATFNETPIDLPNFPEEKESPSFFGIDLKKPFNFVSDLKGQIDSIKETLVSSYDENGNGKIDQGTEFENFKAGVQMLLTLVADKNQNGKIDFEDIGVLTKDALQKVRAQTLTRMCPWIHDQADFAGIFLKLNPLLAHFEKVCVEHDAAVAE